MRRLHGSALRQQVALGYIASFNDVSEVNKIKRLQRPACLGCTALLRGTAEVKRKELRRLHKSTLRHPNQKSEVNSNRKDEVRSQFWSQFWLQTRADIRA